VSDTERTGVPGRRVALLIGNADYAQASPLANPRQDVELVSKSLVAAGFEAQLLINSDYREMRSEITKFARDVRSNRIEAIVLYYAGHGVQLNGENYLLPVDAAIEHEDEVRASAIGLTEVLELLTSSQAGFKIVILDACRNNPYPSAMRAYRGGLAAVANAPRGAFIAYSTSPGTVAFDGPKGGNSPFAEALASAITTPGQQIEDVFKETRTNVQMMTNDRQTPWETSSLNGRFYFLEPDVVDDPATQLRDAWQAIRDSNDPEDFRNFLSVFGEMNAFYRSVAERRISTLEASAKPQPLELASHLPETTVRALSYPEAPPETDRNRVSRFTIDVVVGDTPRRRHWNRIRQNEWVEVYEENGLRIPLVAVKRMMLAGCSGTVVEEVDSNGKLAFIPDKSCPGMPFRISHHVGHWAVATTLQNVE
jgi:hypothetical protein